MDRIVRPGPVGGSLRAPPSKSSTQRAIACAALAPGESILRHPGRSADAAAAIALARGLGAGVEERGDLLIVRGGIPGRGGSAGAARSDASARGPRRLSCGESGLCIRMFAPVAALFPGETLLEAEGSLRARSVGALEGALSSFGASCSTAGGLPPVLVRGPLAGGEGRIDGSGSSQFLTGLLVALPLCARDSLVRVESLASPGYADLTLDTMRAFGVRASRDPDYREFAVPGGQAYAPADFEVEGDWSGAAFLLVAGAIAAGDRPVEVLGLDPASSQPDRAVLEALRLAGAGVEVLPGALAVGRGEPRAFEFDASGCPDLFPPLVALAAACPGRSLLRGARRLAGKESDRAAALREGFAALGIEVETEGDLMTVRGGRARGGRVDSRGDHRIAMAAAVAALSAEGPVAIGDPDCVAKSWPGFFGDLESLRPA